MQNNNIHALTHAHTLWSYSYLPHQEVPSDIFKSRMHLTQVALIQKLIKQPNSWVKKAHRIVWESPFPLPAWLHLSWLPRPLASVFPLRWAEEKAGREAPVLSCRRAPLSPLLSMPAARVAGDNSAMAMQADATGPMWKEMLLPRWRQPLCVARLLAAHGAEETADLGSAPINRFAIWLFLGMMFFMAANAAGTSETVPAPKVGSWRACNPTVVTTVYTTFSDSCRILLTSRPTEAFWQQHAYYVQLACIATCIVRPSPFCHT